MRVDQRLPVRVYVGRCDVPLGGTCACFRPPGHSGNCACHCAIYEHPHANAPGGASYFAAGAVVFIDIAYADEPKVLREKAGNYGIA